MFLANPGECHYEKMQAIFIDNLQMGFVANEIIDRCSELAETAFQLDSSMRLVQLNASISDDLHARILAVFQEPKVVRDALVLLPLEPLDALKAIMSLMSSGHLGYARITIAEDEEPEIVGQNTISTETPPEKRARSAGLLINPLWFLIFPMNGLVNAHTEAWEDPVVEEPQKK